MFQLKFPASVITPPMLVPCPPIHFVADSTTILAPYSIGRQRYPHAPNVLSTTRGKPCLTASFRKSFKIRNIETRDFQLSQHKLLLYCHQSVFQMKQDQDLLQTLLQSRSLQMYFKLVMSFLHKEMVK